MILEQAMAEAPVVAILRGLRPEEAAEMGEALYAAGIRIIEVPLNSPDPLESIRILADTLGQRAIVGAGTVLDAHAVGRVADAGGRIIVSPNTDASVIHAAVARGLEPLPGFVTPSEAFQALGAGATYIKLFPASSLGVGHLKAVKEVLPASAIVLPVGGVRPQDFDGWWSAGARGFGMGGDLYKAGRSIDETAARARAAVEAIRPLAAGQARA
jgi:2-dehydro-3-deoxyphosphogalactonate aldolase